MNLVASLLLVITLTLVFSQFGDRVGGKNSILWWMVSIFLVVAAIYPDALVGISQLAGFQLVSNFVLSALVMFLFLQVFELSAAHTGVSRKLRASISSVTAREACEKLSPSAAAKKILVVVPCYNEEENIPTVISHLQQLQLKDQSVEWLIVNDGSSDRSELLLRELAPNNHVSHSVNIGVSGVLLTGFRTALATGYDYVVQFDCDLQHPSNRIIDLVETAKKDGADILVGSRFTKRGRLENNSGRQSTTVARILGSLVLRSAIALFGVHVQDPTSGFRAYSRRAMEGLIRVLPDEYPEPETIALAAVLGLKTSETWVAMAPRVAGTSSLGRLSSLIYIIKVLTSLLGLRLRTRIKTG
jgi:hypothetical protein